MPAWQLTFCNGALQFVHVFPPEMRRFVHHLSDRRRGAGIWLSRPGFDRDAEWLPFGVRERLFQFDSFPFGYAFVGHGIQPPSGKDKNASITVLTFGQHAVTS